MSTEGWPGPMAPSPQPPPPDPNWRRIVGQLLDHAFDALPSLLLFALAVGTKRLDVEFAAAPLLATTRPPTKPPSVPSRPPARPKPVRG